MFVALLALGDRDVVYRAFLVLVNEIRDVLVLGHFSFRILDVQFSSVQEHIQICLLHFKVTFISNREVPADVVVFNEFLLLRYHVLQVVDCPRLQLQVQHQLHILAFKEVVLDDEVQEFGDLR